jgi:hypothetical protein
MASAMKFFMDRGIAESDAEAIVGNLARESSMNPLAVNAGHAGYAQWDKARQADYAKRFGYQIASSAASADQQSNDQLQFILDELHGKEKKTLDAMAKAKDLMGKTSAFMNLYERPGDNSLGQRFAYAQDAKRFTNLSEMVNSVNARAASVQHTVTSETNIGDVHLHTNSNDPASHAAAFRDGISKQPLVDPSSLVTLSLGTRGMAL